MATYKVLGVMVQPVVVEEDDAGNFVAQHTLSGEFVMHPWGLQTEAAIQRKLAELKPKVAEEPK